MSKVIVTGLKTYNFKKDNGEVLEGVKVSFLSSVRAKGQNENGYLPLQSSLSLDTLENFKEVPGVYEANYDMVPGKGNKPTLAIVGFEFLKSVDLVPLFK
ncbi:hypothetical protein GNF86_14920 [Clostridium perfringens]|jgi:hypothetical protein